MNEYFTPNETDLGLMDELYTDPINIEEMLRNIQTLQSELVNIQLDQLETLKAIQEGITFIFVALICWGVFKFFHNNILAWFGGM